MVIRWYIEDIMTSIHICAELPKMDKHRPASKRKMLAMGFIRCKITPASISGQQGEPEDVRVLGLMVIEDEVESERSGADAE